MKAAQETTKETKNDSASEYICVDVHPQRLIELEEYEKLKDVPKSKLGDKDGGARTGAPASEWPDATWVLSKLAFEKAQHYVQEQHNRNPDNFNGDPGYNDQAAHGTNEALENHVCVARAGS